MRAFRLGFEMEQMSPARHLTFRDVPGSAAELRAAVDAFTGSDVLPADARFDLKVAATEALARKDESTRKPPLTRPL